MKLNSNITEALQFYLDNDLNEVISEKAQNHFLEKDPQKKAVEVAKPATVNNFVKPQYSTNEALSTLAKKSQLPVAIEPAFDHKKFQSLNEIVALAQKSAAAAKTAAPSWTIWLVSSILKSLARREGIEQTKKTADG